MSPEAETPRSLTGEAAWKAECSATEQRNAAAKRAASERQTATQSVFAQRERRLDQQEAKQLKALNKEMAARRVERAVVQRKSTKPPKAPDPPRADESAA
jgi:hypothetical protein